MAIIPNYQVDWLSLPNTEDSLNQLQTVTSDNLNPNLILRSTVVLPVPYAYQLTIEDPKTIGVPS